MKLTGQHITLRALEPADVDLLYKWENDTSIWKVSNTLVPFSKHILEQYIRNTYYILNTCNDFSEEKKGYYFKLYRAQLSRSEAIVVFIGALSSKSKTNFVKLLKSSEFLDVIHYKDLYLLNNEAGEGNEKSFINSMFDEFLKENPE